VRRARLKLDADAVARTIDLLCRRVEERFPDSGSRASAGSSQGSRADAGEGGGDRRPSPLCVAVVLLIVLIATLLAGTLASLKKPREPVERSSSSSPGVRDQRRRADGSGHLLPGHVETRIKRRRALAALRELQRWPTSSNMHQLTKIRNGSWPRPGIRGPAPRLMRFELSRYLDYCSEMLSITARSPPSTSELRRCRRLAAVNEIENSRPLVTKDLAEDHDPVRDGPEA